MIKTKIVNKQTVLALFLLVLPFSVAADPHPGQEAFLEKAAAQGMDTARVSAILDEARYQQSIIDAMTRPAEGKAWHEYRPIFITDKRIAEGVDFWNENRATIKKASEQYGVDEEIIVAIIGVETFYGRITGTYRVLDALTTLGFYYPKRAEFFAGELLHYFQLVEEENLPILEVTGSYAGAMGLGQFIPSSYRAYSVDFDGDGSRDLWGSVDDAIGSVASYFNAHKWRQDELIVLPAIRHKDAQALPKMSHKPESTTGKLAAAGYLTEAAPPPGTPASLLALEQADGPEYWLTMHNFYVITRYNRSPLYAMAVYQLSREILDKM